MHSISSPRSPRWIACLLVLACCGQKRHPAPTQPPGWDADVTMAAAVDLDPAPDIVAVELTAKVATLPIRPGTTSEVWTYNGVLPGPMIRAKLGDRLIVRFKNTLPEPTTIHWHGVRVPAGMDGTGAMQQPVKPGESFEYAFQLLDAGTFWFHPHVRSSAQVGYGLYGALIVEDRRGPPLGDDLVLMLSDASIDATGKLAPGDQHGWFGDYFGREGELVLVNGRVNPRIRARAGVPQRWRLINAARARYFRLVIPGAEMIRVGGDGGLLERPEPLREIALVPGERAEVYVVAAPKQGVLLPVVSKDGNRFHLSVPGPDQEVLSIEVTKDAPYRGAPRPPASLRAIAPMDLAAAKVQRFELMEKSTPAGAFLGINGKTGAEAEPIHALVDTTEIWEVTNTTPYDHPFHLHGFFFQVLAIDGAAPAIREWKDTINVPPDRLLKLGVAFDDRPGMWMFHCHILDHADLGMMGMLMLMK